METEIFLNVFMFGSLCRQSWYFLFLLFLFYVYDEFFLSLLSFNLNAYLSFLFLRRHTLEKSRLLLDIYRTLDIRDTTEAKLKQMNILMTKR